MPEIDKDLYQGLSLLLLAIGTIVLIALLATLSKATKLLREQADRLKELSPGGLSPVAGDLDASFADVEATSESDVGSDVDDDALDAGLADSGLLDESPLEPSPADLDASADLGTATDPDASAGLGTSDDLGTSDEWPSSTPEPVLGGDESGADAFAGITDASGAGSETSSTTDEPVDPFTGETGAAAGGDPFASQPVDASVEDSDPFGAGIGTSATESAATDTASSTDSADSAESKDDDQPFEQGGRWYFRRDGELLVYDETTGEWVDAEAKGGDSPEGQPSQQFDQPGGDVSSGAADVDDGTEAFEAFDAEDEPAPEPEPAGGFWKCPSCGAVNGSTAATCRMCFAARP
jgi:hypothetical protein